MGVQESVLTVAVLAALGAGGYGYWQHDKLVTSEATVAHHTEAIAACGRDKETMRAEREKRDLELTTNLEASQSELDALRAQRAETDKRLEALKALTDKFRKMIDSGQLQVILRHGRMVVKLPAGVLFASGSADVSKDGKAALVEVAAILKQMPDRRFMVAGHTDNVPVPPTSQFKNNLQLSTSRALNVTEQLIASGMNPAHVSASGYSEYEPVRENTTDAGRQENRRIEIVLLPNLEELPPSPGDAPVSASPAASASAAVAPPAPPSASAPRPAASPGPPPGPPTVR
jgi:chemotaxis protein MotB